MKRSLSEKSSGKNNRMYGRNHSEESRKNMSEKRKGLLVGKKNGMYGVDRSGKKNTFYGKTHTEETKRKISEAKKGRSYTKGIPKSAKHKENLAKSRQNLFRENATIYVWYHNNHGEFEGTVYDLIENFPQHNIRVNEMTKVLSERYKEQSHRGWRLIG